MKRQIKLTESELHSVIENAVNKIVSEYTDNEDDYMPYEDKEYGAFNEQPINTIVGENTKKHMKNIVKLTEGQLKAVIRESVGKILAEMDWRTYQSAYDKSGKPKFRRAATNAFNREFGYGSDNIPYGDEDFDGMTSNGDFYGGANGYSTDGNDFFVTSSGKGNVKSDDDVSKLYGTQAVGTSGKNRGKSIDIKSKDAPEQLSKYNDKFKKSMSFNPKLKLAQMKGDKSVRDYFSGKSKYQPGEGWR